MRVLVQRWEQTTHLLRVFFVKPLLVVGVLALQNQKAAKAHERRVAKSNEALLASAEGGPHQNEEDQEEQVEEVSR